MTNRAQIVFDCVGDILRVLEFAPVWSIGFSRGHFDKLQMLSQTLQLIPWTRNVGQRSHHGLILRLHRARQSEPCHRERSTYCKA